MLELSAVGAVDAPITAVRAASRHPYRSSIKPVELQPRVATAEAEVDVDEGPLKSRTVAFDWLVFIGRFQPFHLGHLAVVREALRQAPNVLVLVGSANRPRSIRNPFTFDERCEMIRACFDEQDNPRLHLEPLDDVLYNDARWIANVQQAVAYIAGEARIGLIGHAKDRSAYYLKQFPAWGSVDVPNHDGHSATDIRKAFFAGERQTQDWIDARLPPPVIEFLEQFALPMSLTAPTREQLRAAIKAAASASSGKLKAIPSNPAYAALLAEARYVERFQAEFASLRYPPTFNTVDAVVVQSGHVLLVRRGLMPGKGQIALPGGFISPDEPALDACLRELREETRLKVPEPVLRGSLTGREFFDDPYRSVRGRTFTMAFRFELRADHELPKVKGGDDAKEAFWMPLGLIDPCQMFEDHYFILQKMLGI